MAEDVSRATRAVREALDAIRLRASRWGAPRPRFWIDERTTKSCFECGVTFSLVTRKHHCRVCGRVFCQKCSSNALCPRNDPEGPAERACDVCFASHAAAAEPPRASNSRAKNRVPARSPRVPDAARSHVASDRLARSSPTSDVPSQPTSASASRRARGRGSASESTSESESDEDESESDEDDDAGAGDADADAVVSDSTRNGAACVLTRRDEKNPTVRVETRRPDTGADTRVDETETPRERRDGPRPKRYRAGKPTHAAHAAHAAALADPALWAPPSSGLEQGTRSTLAQTTTTAARDANSVNAALSRLSARFLRRSFDAANVFVSSSEGRADASVETWTPFVSALALECARALEPSRFRVRDARRTDAPSRGTVRDGAYDMDPLSRVSIRKIAAGTPASSALARDACSLRRNVADRRMAKTRGVVHAVSAERLVSLLANDIDASSSSGDKSGDGDEDGPGAAADRASRERFVRADFAAADARDGGTKTRDSCGSPPPRVRVALLGGALEYQRATDTPRLASFSTLLDQEHEHLRAATARALVSKPDVALVERTVARFARDLFLERGVSLALGVGGDELRRLAYRLAPRELASRARDELAADGGAVRGTCAGWSVETPERTLFDDDAAARAATDATGTETGTETETEPETAGNGDPSRERNSEHSGTTTFMTFFGLVPGSGCVLTLRGATPRALDAVASATRASVRAAYHLDRVSAFVSVAAASRDSEARETRRTSTDRFANRLLARAAESTAVNETVPLVSRAFCPSRVASHACDPPVGFRSSLAHRRGDVIPRVVPYGPEDLPLGDALAQATAAERGATECPHARCGEHPAAHVRSFYVPGGRITMCARRAERGNEPASRSASRGADAAPNGGGAADDVGGVTSENGETVETVDKVAWTYWSRCLACARADDREAKTRERRGPAFPTRALGVSGSAVPAPERALELSLARFLEMLGLDAPATEANASTRSESRDAREGNRDARECSCVRASLRRLAHYFASPLGTVRFAFEETSPVSLVVSPASRLGDREGLASGAPRGDARYDARCAAAAAALRSDAYAAAMRSFGSGFGFSSEEARNSRARDAPDDVSPRGADHVVVAEHGVVAYFAPQFRAARAAWWRAHRDEADAPDASRANDGETDDVEAIFAAALAECAVWDVGARGGKSGAFFARSRDGRFVVKQVSKVELECLVAGGFAAAYFARLARGARTRAPTLLAATLGAFTAAPRGRAARERGEPEDLDFVVLENAFHGADADGNASWRTYDLKGSLRGRYAVTGGHEARSSAAPLDGVDATVLMDGNLAETCAIDPILIGRDGFATLETAIRADVAFLAARNVMDYSLLVGIDRNPDGRREAFVRIIDYLRPYTWDKQIESAVKSGVPSAEGAPTVLSPEKYARRFRRAARRYFLAVPDGDSDRRRARPTLEERNARDVRPER